MEDKHCPMGLSLHRKLSPTIFLGGLTGQTCSFDSSFKKFWGERIKKAVGPFLVYGNLLQRLSLSRKIGQQMKTGKMSSLRHW